MSQNEINQLLSTTDLQIINLGLSRFAETLAKLEIKAIHVDWRPPAEGDRDLTDILTALRGNE